MKEWPKPTIENLSMGFLARYGWASQFVKNKTVLDLGCGAGYSSMIMKEKGGAKKVFGLDKDPQAILYAQKNYQNKGVEFVVADAQKIPFKGNFFDIVVSLEVIEHLFDPNKYLVEVKRVLKKDGLLMLSTPNRAAPSRKTFNIRRPPYHRKEYNHSELKELLLRFFSEVQIMRQDIPRIKFAENIQFIPKEIRKLLSKKARKFINHQFNRLFLKKEICLFNNDFEKADMFVAICQK